MNSDKLNKWLTLVANLAVVIGILVLVVEINQNTAAIEQNATWMRLQSLDNGTDQNSDFRHMLLNDEKLFRIWRDGCLSKLDKEETERYQMLSVEFLILIRSNGERLMALGGEERLKSHAEHYAPQIQVCPLMRAEFDKLSAIALISPEWYASVQKALAQLDEAN